MTSSFSVILPAIALQFRIAPSQNSGTPLMPCVSVRPSGFVLPETMSARFLKRGASRASYCNT